MLNRLSFVFMLFLFANSAGAQDVQARVTSNSATAGVYLQYELVSALGPPFFQELPAVDGLRWLGEPSSRNSNTFINGRRTSKFSTIYSFVCTKPGSIKIPGAGVKLQNRQSALTANDVVVQVQSAEHIISFPLTYNGQAEPPEQLFVGQELVIGMELLVNTGIRMHPGFVNRQRLPLPSLSFDNDNVKFSQGNTPAERFNMAVTSPALDDRTRKMRKIGNHTFAVFPYETAVSSDEVGTISGHVSHTFYFVPQAQRRDPIAMFRNTAERLYVESSIPEIPVIKRPPANPADGTYLNLIGEWEISASTDKPTVKVNDAVELILTVRGKGDLSKLMPPALELPGFRQFDPSVDKDKGKIVWTAIPLHKDSQFPTLRLATFSPQQGKYVTHEVRAQVTVEEGDAVSSTPLPVMPSTGDPGDILLQGEQPASQSNILYIKPKLSAYLQVPLGRNAQGFVWLLLLAGPLGFFGLTLLLARQEKLSGNMAYRRKHDAQRKRAAVFASLKAASPEAVVDVIRDELVPYLIAVKELPPGATMRDLIAVVDDDELVKILEAVEASGFMPGSGPTVDTDRLLSLVAKFAAWLLVGLLANSAIPAQAQDPMSEAASGYEKSEIEAAESIYAELQRPGRANAHLLYNLGNCAYQRGDYGLSIARYEQARRLKPRDSDISENLNFVRGQLKLPPIRDAEDPLSVLAGARDQIRPDEWLRLGAIAWLVFWVLLAVRRWKRLPLLIPAGVALSVAGLCLLSWFTQQQSTYRDNQGVILAASTPVFAVPQAGDDHAAAKQTVDSGKYVDIQEWRNEWLRVRVDQDEGWVRRSAVAVIWNNQADFQ